MKGSSTLFLKVVVILIGIGVLALCATILSVVTRADMVGMYRPILIGLYVPAIPFFIAFYQSLKLLRYIDTGKAFSGLSVTALGHIKRCAASIGALFIVGMPYIFMVADKDDAPGVVLIGLVIMAASLVIAVFSAVLQKLLREALSLKSENDLTV
jgi:hypothetical protein